MAGDVFGSTGSKNGTHRKGPGVVDRREYRTRRMDGEKGVRNRSEHAAAKSNSRTVLQPVKDFARPATVL